MDREGRTGRSFGFVFFWWFLNFRRFESRVGVPSINPLPLPGFLSHRLPKLSFPAKGKEERASIGEKRGPVAFGGLFEKENIDVPFFSFLG